MQVVSKDTRVFARSFEQLLGADAMRCRTGREIRSAGQPDVPWLLRIEATAVEAWQADYLLHCKGSRDSQCTS